MYRKKHETLFSHIPETGARTARGAPEIRKIPPLIRHRGHYNRNRKQKPTSARTHTPRRLVYVYVYATKVEYFS